MASGTEPGGAGYAVFAIIRRAQVVLYRVAVLRHLIASLAAFAATRTGIWVGGGTPPNLGEAGRHKYAMSL